MPHSLLGTPEPPTTTTVFSLLSLSLMTLSTLQKGSPVLFPLYDWQVSQSVMSLRFTHGVGCVLPNDKSCSIGCVNVFGLSIRLLLV